MAKLLLTEEGEFEVGENKVLNYIVSGIFLCMFLFGLVEAFSNSFGTPSYFYFLLLLLLLPAIYFLKKAKSKKIFIRVNKNGIYQNELLVTNWDHFLKAAITQKEKLFMSIQDNFLLVVEYTKKNDDKGFRRKIPLINTQNKSEEEVLEAIKYFWHQHHGTEVQNVV